MSSNKPILYIDVRVFVHATEDSERVLKAVQTILPAESIETISFGKVSLTGHHGNPIVLFETRIKNKKTAQTVFEKMSSSLNLIDKETLSSEFMQHVEKGNLYIRLDKQSAFLDELRLGSSDAIRLRIHFKNHGSREILDICRKYGLLP